MVGQTDMTKLIVVFSQFYLGAQKSNFFFYSILPDFRKFIFFWVTMLRPFVLLVRATCTRCLVEMILMAENPCTERKKFLGPLFQPYIPYGLT